MCLHFGETSAQLVSLFPVTASDDVSFFPGASSPFSVSAIGLIDTLFRCSFSTADMQCYHVWGFCH